MTYYNGGYESASLVWNFAVPLLAAFFIGPRASLVSAVLLIGETVGFYWLDQTGYAFPRPLSAAWVRWFHMAGSSALLAFIALLGILYERLYHSMLEVADRQQAALRESKERYALVLHGTNDGLWDWNGLTGEYYSSPRFEELLGYQEGELEPIFKTFTSRLHPEDKNLCLRAAENHIQHRVPYEVEYVSFQ